jgi:hypothetical protein
MFLKNLCLFSAISDHPTGEVLDDLPASGWASDAWIQTEFYTVGMSPLVSANLSNI